MPLFRIEKDPKTGERRVDQRDTGERVTSPDELARRARAQELREIAALRHGATDDIDAELAALDPDRPAPPPPVPAPPAAPVDLLGALAAQLGITKEVLAARIAAPDVIATATVADNIIEGVTTGILGEDAVTVEPTPTPKPVGVVGKARVPCTAPGCDFTAASPAGLASHVKAHHEGK